MENKLYEMINGKYDDITIKKSISRYFINLDTYFMMKSLIELKTKDNVSLKELERKYIKGGIKNEID